MVGGMIIPKNNLLECDLILKGGITSGVVYPGVVSELRKTYRFRNIGGTSAGAIAAAATAAAEVGRQTGKGGFDKLDALPEWLGADGGDGHTNLSNLFQPNEVAQPFQAILQSLLGESKNLSERLIRLLRAVTSTFTLAGLIGLIPGITLMLLAVYTGTGSLAPISALAGLVLAAIGFIVGLTFKTYRSTTHALKENYLGLTTGHNYDGSATSPMLTDWLTDFLDDLAGVKDRDKPLTFGDLEAQGVNLHVITTCVTHGRPYGLPFREVEKGKPGRFYIKQADAEAFFPRKVANWLEQKRRDDCIIQGTDTYLRFPTAADLPIVVATRLSLSFPLLISAVPLYAVDFTRKDNKDKVLERCWFTDGGISSNFPVHLFDAPLPTRPTFAVNLRPHHIDHGPGSEAFERNQGVWMPNRNGDGSLAWWHRFEQAGGLGSFLAFIKATVETGLNWQDTLLAGSPGHRDRIVHIGLSPHEGGLNLNMECEIIQGLFDRGKVAGGELVSRFANGEHELDWDNHRWLRYRILMSALEDMHSKLERAYKQERAGERTYEQLLKRGKKERPKSYHFAKNSLAHQTLAEQVTEDLLELTEKWSKADLTLQEGSPKPHPKVRLTPEA